MKKKILLGIVLLVSASAVWLASTSATAQKAPPSAPPGSTLEQRIAQRKKERKIKLEKRDIQRLENRCTKIQSFLRQNQNKLSQTADNRTKTYQRIDAKLWIIIGKLKLGERDTIVLEKQRIALAKKVNAYQVTMKDYKQSIDDIVVMNCEADVVGFMAMVETARLYHARIRTQVADIQSYVIDSIKASLSKETAALQPQAPEGDN